ncbi:MAG: RNA polymerase sigma factor [Fimbriimonadaceae bacterium]|nr:RNA polymerase sigma factor [Chitinophagales bacterium]
MTIEPALLKKCASGERQAQNKLYKQSFSLLMGVCSRYTKNKDDAMALLNLGFCKILMHADKYKEHIPPELWMRRVMINTAIDEFRKNKNYNEQTQLKDFSDHSVELSYDDSEANLYDAKIESERLQQMLNELPNITGKVFNLFAIDGYSHKEIAELLGMSEGTSKWHVNNARTLLKQMLKESYVI